MTGTGGTRTAHVVSRLAARRRSRQTAEGRRQEDRRQARQASLSLPKAPTPDPQPISISHLPSRVSHGLTPAPLLLASDCRHHHAQCPTRPASQRVPRRAREQAARVHYRSGLQKRRRTPADPRIHQLHSSDDQPTPTDTYTHTHTHTSTDTCAQALALNTTRPHSSTPNALSQAPPVG